MTKGKILVCGGAGFIGKRLIEKLVCEGRDVKALIHHNIPLWEKDVIDRIEIMRGNILDSEAVNKALEEVQEAVNLVGAYSENLYDLNIRASYNLLKACKNKRMRRVVFISTTMVYGECNRKPAVESDPPFPSTEYAFTKYMAETIHGLYSEKQAVPVTVVRLSNTYGPGKRVGAVHNFIQAFLQKKPMVVHNDGKQKRDFLYIDDAVQGIIKAIDYRARGNYEIFNIAGAELISLLDLVSMIEKAGKRKATVEFSKYSPPDVSCSWSSYRKAQELTGYMPEVAMRKGIDRTLLYVQHLLEGEAHG